MFLKEFYKYSRLSEVIPEEPIGILVFITELYSINIPSQIVPSPTNQLIVYLKISNKSQTSNTLYTDKYIQTQKPTKIVLNLPILTVLSKDDQLNIQVVIECGQFMSILTQFQISINQHPDLSCLFTNQIKPQTISADKAKMQVLIANHSLLQYPPNFIFNCNIPPLFLIKQGYLQFKLEQQVHWINATIINKPRNQPFYKLNLIDSGLSFSSLNRKLPLQEVSTDIKDKILDTLIQGIELINDVIIDRQSIQFSIDRYILQVTSHSGLLPLTRKQFNLSTKPTNQNFEVNAFELFQQKSASFNFTESSVLAFEFIVQVSIFIGGASSMQIIEPFQDALTYTVAWGYWDKTVSNSIKLDQQRPFSSNSILKIDDLDITISVKVEAENAPEVNTANLINVEIIPPENYYTNIISEDNEFNLIKLENEEYDQIDFTEVSPVEIRPESEIAQIQATFLYPVNVKFRIYTFQPLVKNFFGQQIKFRLISESSLKEIQSVESSYQDTDFADQLTLSFNEFFKGVIVSFRVQLVMQIDQLEYVVGEQFIPISNTKILQKCKADCYTQVQNNQFSQNIIDQNFFDLLIQEVICDSYFDLNPPEIAIIQVQFQLIYNSEEEYDIQEDKQNIMDQNDEFQAAILSKIGDFEKYLQYQKVIKQAFYTPQRMLGLSKLSQNSIYRHYIIQNTNQCIHDILYDLRLDMKKQYKLSLLYPDPIVLNGLDFKVKFENGEVDDFDHLGLTSELKVEFSLNCPKPIKYSRLKVVFALSYNLINIGHIHCIFDIIETNKNLTSPQFLLTLPYKTSLSYQIILRTHKSTTTQISPNCNGVFLPPIQSQNKQPTSLKLYQLPNSINIARTNVIPLISKLTPHSIQIEEINQQSFNFIQLTLTPEFLSNFPKQTLQFVLTNSIKFHFFTLSLQNYCDVAATTGALLKIPKFSEKPLLTYPPHDSGQVRIMSIFQQQIRSLQPKYIVNVTPEDSPKIIKKYFLKTAGNELKYLIFSDFRGEISTFSEFPSLVQTRKCRICDEGWMIPVQVLAAIQGFRQQVRVFVVGGGGMLGYFLLEVQWS